MITCRTSTGDTTPSRFTSGFIASAASGSRRPKSPASKHLASSISTSNRRLRSLRCDLRANEPFCIPNVKPRKCVQDQKSRVATHSLEADKTKREYQSTQVLSGSPPPMASVKAQIPKPRTRNASFTFTPQTIISPRNSSFCVVSIKLFSTREKNRMQASKNFADCIYRVTNLLGDADTTRAIAGQITVAFYGYQSPSSVPLPRRMLKNLNRCDPLYEIRP